MNNILKELEEGLDRLSTKPDAKKMNLNHAIVLSDKYFQQYLERRK